MSMLYHLCPTGSAQASESQVEISLKGEHAEETPDPKDAGDVEPVDGGSRPTPDQASFLLRNLVIEASIISEARHHKIHYYISNLFKLLQHESSSTKE